MLPKWTPKVMSRWKAMRGWRDTDAGQALVEFSLVLPIFLVLLFALVDFGRGFYTWLLITNAAREGAREAAVSNTVATAKTKIYDSVCRSYATNDCSLDTSASVFVITPGGIPGLRGTEATIDITYTFQFVTPIGALLSLPIFGGTSISAPTLRAHSGMRHE